MPIRTPQEMAKIRADAKKAMEAESGLSPELSMDQERDYLDKKKKKKPLAPVAKPLSKFHALFEDNE